MAQDNITITHGKMIITLAVRTLRQRDRARQVSAKLAGAPVSAQTRGEFAGVVASTLTVQNGWQPPAWTASADELTAALDHWLDEVGKDLELVDKWVNGVYGETQTPQSPLVPTTSESG